MMATTDGSGRYLPPDWTLPAITAVNEAFFHGGADGELRLQRCRACGVVQHPPDELCRHCQAMELGSVVARPGGTVVSYSIVHHAVHPTLRAVVPYNVVVVELDEYPDVRIVGNVIDAAPDDLHIGMPVICTWAELPGADGDSVFLPQWSRVSQ